MRNSHHEEKEADGKEETSNDVEPTETRFFDHLPLETFQHIRHPKDDLVLERYLRPQREACQRIKRRSRQKKGKTNRDRESRSRGRHICRSVRASALDRVNLQMFDVKDEARQCLLRYISREVHEGELREKIAT